MASSADEPQNLRDSTPAPPPTPSIAADFASNSDALSTFLRRLPPTLSLSPPPRRSSAVPPLLSLSDPTPNLQTALLSAATKLGFFHLKHRATVAGAESLFRLPRHRKQLLFPSSRWPLGYDDEDDHGESFCVDCSSSRESINDLDLDFDALIGFGGEMETLGWRLIRELSSVIGFEVPNQDELRSMLWISDDGANKPGRVYPYVVGLHCAPGSRNCSLCSDSGWVNVSGQEDSVLITLGDIAQVWSNGKLKKVRGRPMPCLNDVNSGSSCVTLSLLITLPIESMVFPRTPNLAVVTDDFCEGQDSGDGGSSSINDSTTEPAMFHSFPFEDYAWRIYHERLNLKDPLLRYRVH